MKIRSKQKERSQFQSFVDRLNPKKVSMKEYNGYMAQQRNVTNNQIQIGKQTEQKRVGVILENQASPNREVIQMKKEISQLIHQDEDNNFSACLRPFVYFNQEKQEQLNSSKIDHPQRNTYSQFIQNLTNQNQKVTIHQMIIKQMKENQQKKDEKINHLNRVIHSFYTKGAPLQSQLAKQTFDGSYPTLVQQADHMRKLLADTQKQLQLVKEERSKYKKEIQQCKSQLKWFTNRIMDLERRLYQTQDRCKDMQRQKQSINKNNQHSKQLQEQNHSLKQRLSELEKDIAILRNQKAGNLDKKVENPQNLRKARQKQSLLIESSNSFDFEKNKQLQLSLLQSKLRRLRDENSQLENQQSFHQNRKIYKALGSPEVSISILDENQRDPYTYRSNMLNKTGTTLLTNENQKK